MRAYVSANWPLAHLENHSHPCNQTPVVRSGLVFSTRHRKYLGLKQWIETNRKRSQDKQEPYRHCATTTSSPSISISGPPHSSSHWQYKKKSLKQQRQTQHGTQSKKVQKKTERQNNLQGCRRYETMHTGQSPSRLCETRASWSGFHQDNNKKQWHNHRLRGSAE